MLRLISQQKQKKKAKCSQAVSSRNSSNTQQRSQFVCRVKRKYISNWVRPYRFIKKLIFLVSHLAQLHEIHLN